MSYQSLVISVIAIIASCNASGFGHLPTISALPITRYAPFYNFPTGVRSIHAVASAAIGAPVLPAPAPLLPAPAPVLPAPAFPAPIFQAARPAISPGPVYSYFAPALPRFAPVLPALPKLAPIVPAYPPAPIFARSALPVAPFSPIVRAVAPALPAPIFAPAPPPVFAPAPAPIAVAKALPFAYPPHHIPYAPAPIFKQVAWK